MNIIIRECAESDASAIHKLNRDELGYEHPLSDTAEKLRCLLTDSSHKILVACIGELIVGYVHANDYDSLYAPHLKNIMGIAVSGEHRGLGIGRALLENIERWAKDTGAAGIRLVSGAERTGAHAFYEKCGYTVGKQQLNIKKFL